MAGREFSKTLLKSFLLGVFLFSTFGEINFSLEAAGLSCPQAVSSLVEKIQTKMKNRRKLENIRTLIRNSVRDQNDFHLVYLNRESNRWEIESFSPLDAQLLLKDGIRESDSVHIPGQKIIYSWLDFLLPSEVDENEIQDRNLKLKLEEDAQKIRQNLAFPHHWAVGPGANSRRVQALKNILNIRDEGGIPLLKQIQVHDPEKYQVLRGEILRFIKNYFLSDNSNLGLSVVNGSLNPEDLLVIEKDARDFVEHLYQMTGDAKFNPETIFNQEMRVRKAVETEQEKREREIIEDWVLKFRIRLHILAEDAKTIEVNSSIEEIRERFFSGSLIDEFRYLQRNIVRIHPDGYEDLRKEVIQFIQQSLVEKGKGPDFQLVGQLKKFVMQVGDGNFLPERVFPEDLALRQDGTRSAYLLYESLSGDLQAGIDEDRNNPKRALRKFIVDQKTLATAQKLSDRDDGASFKKAFASDLKRRLRVAKIHEDFSFDDDLQNYLSVLSVILGDPDIMKEGS